jgi:hypothetical protein
MWKTHQEALSEFIRSAPLDTLNPKESKGMPIMGDRKWGCTETKQKRAFRLDLPKANASLHASSSACFIHAREELKKSTRLRKRGVAFAEFMREEPEEALYV